MIFPLLSFLFFLYLFISCLQLFSGSRWLLEAKVHLVLSGSKENASAGFFPIRAKKGMTLVSLGLCSALRFTSLHPHFSHASGADAAPREEITPELWKCRSVPRAGTALPVLPVKLREGDRLLHIRKCQSISAGNLQ